MYSSTLLSTSKLDGGGWSTPLPDRFTPGKTRYPLFGRLGGPQARSGWVRKISPPPGFDPRSDQPVASRYTDWAIPAPTITKGIRNSPTIYKNKIEKSTGCIFHFPVQKQESPSKWRDWFFTDIFSVQYEQTFTDSEHFFFEHSILYLTQWYLYQLPLSREVKTCLWNVNRMERRQRSETAIKITP